MAEAVASSRSTAVMRTGRSRGAEWNHVRSDGLADARAARAPSAAPAATQPAIVATTTTIRRPRHRLITVAAQAIARTINPPRDPYSDKAPATAPTISGIATKRAGADMQSGGRAFQAGFAGTPQIGTRTSQKQRPRSAPEYAELRKGDRSLFGVRDRTNKSDLSPFPWKAATLPPKGGSYKIGWGEAASKALETGSR
jgi:hypothetical protein